MKKIIVIGCPGSGKSRFSMTLGRNTGIPVYHLDMMFWNADKTTVPKSVFLERLTAVLGGDEWIIDGNYASTMEMRLAECDTVFFLDYPTDVCLDGIRQRRGKARADMPWIETEADADFEEYVKRFEGEQRPCIFDLINRYESKNVFIFKSREQARAFLDKTVKM